jgi:hypothetical protein
VEVYRVKKETYLASGKSTRERSISKVFKINGGIFGGTLAPIISIG